MLLFMEIIVPLPMSLWLFKIISVFIPSDFTVLLLYTSIKIQLKTNTFLSFLYTTFTHKKRFDRHETLKVRIPQIKRNKIFFLMEIFQINR